ncbi:uncharacterized protein K02A2.6-like [Macrosteles quadrilineatus]|uniref:uncharacterized protein K02A2.6-like n=1 Tax=Macrosteles quadrilineatus TaxID=74068 RepID=UPI0023E164F7|nr:uncharacterized protein K02A2.6-like [Macrosteles quadrilineatus]
MDKILAGIENVHCYLDDILITSQSFEDMYEKVKEVLSRLQQYGVRINAGKSEFFRDSLTFLGHRLDARGIYPSEELTADIVKAPRPTDLTQLRSYIGLLNYYGKFLPNLSTLLHPLYNLLNKGVKWSWSEECERAFQKSKELLLTNKVLIPFNPKLDIVVMADASPYGVGGVISHRLPDGSEKPIAFGSRTLSVHEARYSQIEKEALALVFVVKKFHTFLYGRRFILATDHRPLTFLLGHNKSIPTLAAARIQRWALTLAAYDYELVYRKGSDMCNADAMSRLPCNVDCNPDEVVAFFSSIDEMPITFKEISLATRHDPVLSKVLDHTLNGWPSYNNSPQLKPYFSRSTELSVEQDCLLWGRRVVIPAPHRKEVLALLHKEHPGESRMKNLARSYVWWPNMDNDLEEMVKNCFICQSTRNSLQLAPLQQWSWPKHCWQRIHIDFASFHNKEFLIIIDSFSKWMEVIYMTSITSAKTIEKLRTCFSAYGLPSTLVSDGGPQLNSKEFDDFLKANAILHVVTPPYHPASNGLAERAVQTTKKSFIRQLLHDEKSGEPRALQHRIDSFLFAYRNTPHSTTGSTPAELFLRFVPRNHLSLLKPHLARSVDEKQLKMEEAANKRRGKFRSFVVGEEVYVKSVRQESLNWMPGQVVKVVSQVTYLVKVQGRTRFVHADHLRPKFGTNVEEETLMTLPTPVSPGRPKTSPGINKTVEEMKDGCEMDQPIIQDEVHEPDPVKTVKTPSPGGPLRRSQRERKPPRKLDL